ncbi:MAG: hypothetical protein KIT84_43065 [Labilithrix sp.]|nr:hypothetical protein [Labilithrix sp.]MCW5817861.1 hypothetical protein [Labilithrix sp.]
MHDVVMLETPPLPRVVDDGVFDAYGWCASDVLEWRRPRVLSTERRVESANPPGLVFVLRDASAHAFLPRELARLHAFGYGLDDEEALAPWAIDDATDRLYEHRARPHDVFWLAAPALDTLVWGLHDWAHFHNHGPFDRPAMTELQCDLLALAWLRRNARAIGLDDAALGRVAHDLAALSRGRFADEGVAAPVPDLDALFSGPYPAAPLAQGHGGSTASFHSSV